VPSPGLVDLRDLVFERFMPQELHQLLALAQTALEARLGRLPAHLAIPLVVAGAVQGEAEKRQRLWASPAPCGSPLGKTAEGYQTGWGRLQCQGTLRQALDEYLRAPVRVGLVVATDDDISTGAEQGRLTVPPRLHHALAPEGQAIVAGELAQHDAHTPPLGHAVLAGRDGPVCQPPGLQPPPDQAQDAWLAYALFDTTYEPGMLSSAKAIGHVGLVDPAAWCPCHDFLQSCSGRMCPDARTAPA
jgi:hypothetical protein